MDDFEKRIKSEARSVTRITNSLLKCKDCRFKLDDSKILGNTSQCRQYLIKPNQVLKGKDCSRYKKED